MDSSTPQFAVGGLLPHVLWFTGLSGSGKSTLASAVVRELRSQGLRTESLDGDQVRAWSPTGFTRADRDAHIRRVGHAASTLELEGAIVSCALISPYAESRSYVRRLCRRFVEIYVATPIEVCEGRDVKGLYAKARRGELRRFTGIDDPYEPPENPELSLDTTSLTVTEAVATVLRIVVSLQSVDRARTHQAAIADKGSDRGHEQFV